MPGLVDRLKEGRDRAAFEADRLRRVTQAQASLKALVRQVESQTAALGVLVLELHDAGRLAQPELESACARLDALRRSAADLQVEIDCARQERPAAGPIPAPTLTGRICPSCQIELPVRAAFCPNCGGPAVDMLPPQQAGTACASCGSIVPAGAAFCGLCGARAGRSTPAAACLACGATVPAGAAFCPECGARLVTARADPASSPQAGEPGISPEAAAQEAHAGDAPVPAEGEASPPPGSTACPACGALIPVGAPFCPRCGSLGGTPSI